MVHFSDGRVVGRQPEDVVHTPDESSMAEEWSRAHEEEAETLFAYDYGEDFPESLVDLGRLLLGGRPINQLMDPLQQIQVLATAAEFRAPAARGAGKGKLLPFSAFEKEMERELRKSAQTLTHRLVLPKRKVESSDAFIRRLDAHRQATEAIIIPLTAPEDEALFAKRMIAVKANETPNCIVLPKTARESVQEFECRMEMAKKSPSPLIFPRGTHESGAQFHTRLQAQLKSKRPIVPRSIDEPDKGFSERCRLQPKCEKVIHPFDPKREDEQLYLRRLMANSQKSALAFEPGDKRAIDDAIGTEHKQTARKVEPVTALGSSAADLMSAAEEETVKAKVARPEAEAAEAAKLAEAQTEEEEAALAAERVAQRIAAMKLKAAEEVATACRKSFALEQISIDAIGFMPLKKLLIERGVPKEEVFGAPTKFALQEVAKKWDEVLKIEWTEKLTVRT